MGDRSARDGKGPRVGPILVCVLLGLSLVPLLPTSSGEPLDEGTDLGGVNQLLWSTFVGSESWDLPTSIAVDPSGDVYITGRTHSGNFPTTQGAYDTSFNGDSDIFVAKLAANGSAIMWSTFVGGSSYDYGGTVVLDPSGDLVVSGYTRSSDFPTTQGCYDNSSNGEEDVVVFKLDANGSSLEFSTYLGGEDTEYADLVLGPGNDVYLSGCTYSTDFPTTPGAYDRTLGATGSDIFVTRMKHDGSALVYSTYVGGSRYDYCVNPPVLDDRGRAFVAGSSDSADFPAMSGCYDNTSGGGFDAVVFRLAANGSALEASTYLGGASYDLGYSIGSNREGEVVIAGMSSSPGYPVVPGCFDTSHNGDYDAIVSILDADLTELLHSTYVGGSGEDSARALTIDGNGTVYLTGRTASSDYPVKADYFDGSYNGNDVFITRLSADLETMYNSTFIGSAGGNTFESIAIDAGNDVHVTGSTTSSAFPVTSGAYDTTFNSIVGRTDAFVLKCRFPEDPNHFLDDDNDGVLNWADAFPRNPFEFRDTDGDGVGDNLDPDADGDGTPDDSDDFPLDPSENRDTDRDGVGDNADTDDDGDGVNDTADAFPLNPKEILDSDGDGIGDRLDPDDDNDNVTDEQELLNTIEGQFANLSTALDLVGTLLRGELEGINASLHHTLDLLSEGFLVELRGVNASLASDIQAALDSISGSLDGLDVSISTDVSDLGTWLSEALAALDQRLARANGTLHTHLADLEERTATFYEGLEKDLGVLSADLASMADDLSAGDQVIVDDIEDLSKLVSNLAELTLEELRTRLSGIAANLSAFDDATAQRLTIIVANISAFEASTSSDLEDLEKLSAILDDLEHLDADLSSAQEEVEAAVEDASSEEMGRHNVNLALLVLVIVLVVLVLLLVRRTIILEGGRVRRPGED